MKLSKVWFEPKDITCKDISNIDFWGAENISDLKKLKLDSINELNKETLIAIDYILDYSEKFKLDIEKFKINNVVNRILKDFIKSDDWNLKELWLELHNRYLRLKNIKLKKVNIEWNKKNIELENDSLVDELTWLLNRKWYSIELEKLIKNKKENFNNNFCLLAIDIDFFKQINDTYLHDVWDKVLVELANIFRNTLRNYDIISRQWWEEFFILLPSTDINWAKEVAEKIRKEVELNLNVNTNNKLEWIIIDESITVSIWIATAFDSIEEWEYLRKMADKALYKAKNSWRNTICIEK